MWPVIVQVFREGSPPNDLCALDSCGRFWRRIVRGFGYDGRDTPKDIHWELDAIWFPALPDVGGGGGGQ